MRELSPLFKPLKIGNRVAPNRIVINAMECCDALPNGDPSPETYARYERLFEGKAGIVVLEAITPQYDHRSRKDQLSIREHNLPALKKFVAHLKKINPDTILLFQITHSGEISNPEFSTRIRVTKEPLPGYEDAKLVGEKEIDEVIDQYIQGSKYAYEVGADGVDLKLCHGYLGSQILRPYNKENWKYGGRWENRKQFAINIYDGVRAAIPDPNFVLGSKISIYEGFPGGFGTLNSDSACMDLTEPIDLIKTLEAHGANFILQSAGSPSITLDLAHPDVRTPDYAYIHFYLQKACRNALRPETAVIGSGYSIYRDGKKGFHAVKKEKNTLRFWGEKNINEGVVDAIAIGRQSYADPYLPTKMEKNDDASIKWCTLCDHCVEMLIQQTKVGCATFDKKYTQEYLNMIHTKGSIKEKHT
ncbi:oxidoreductase [Lacrimispora sp.]|uniref:oxidoreductase n=1 Tax=Lacrimispora sp. TaxID=2719234 RepID=UPI00289A91CA|nr:2,4-dienoyl-CoA reductase [Lacrimispora sp.]